MKTKNKYQDIKDYFKKKIQTGVYGVGSYLPSENEIRAQYATTRTTVRKALDELLKEGYIEKEHGRGSRVLERGKSLGLLTLKGFSGVTDYEVKTRVTQKPKLSDWDDSIDFKLTEEERRANCVFFQRVRYINKNPIVVENNWYSSKALELIPAEDFVDGSFFKTLMQKHLIEITGAEQKIRAEPSSFEIAKKLNITPNSPILNISVRFRTSRAGLNLYGNLYCNTAEHPIGNSYFR